MHSTALRGLRSQWWFVSLVSLAAHTLAAQPATPPPTPAPQLPSGHDSIGFHADFGLVSTSGNTSVTTVNASDAFTFRTSPSNTISQSFGVVYGTQLHRVQTSLWVAGLRNTYTFNQRVGVFALLNFDRNTFAGIDRRFEEGLGAAILAVSGKNDKLEIDIGASYIQQRSTEAVEDDYPAGRGALDYRHTFGKDEYFEQTIEAVPDLTKSSNYQLNTQTNLVAPLSRKLAIKLGYTIRYNNLPPPGFKTTDRFFTSDVQVTL